MSEKNQPLSNSLHFACNCGGNEWYKVKNDYNEEFIICGRCGEDKNKVLTHLYVSKEMFEDIKNWNNKV